MTDEDRHADEKTPVGVPGDPGEAKGEWEVYAAEADDEPPRPLNTYLVSEVQKAVKDMSAPPSHHAAMANTYGAEESPIRFLGGGGMVVAAEDPDEAVKIVMAETQRLGSYMVVECVLIDFAVNLRQQRAARGRTLRLNPGDQS